MSHISCLPTGPSHPHSGLNPKQDSIATKWSIKSSSHDLLHERPADALGTGNNMSQFGCVWHNVSYHINYCSKRDPFESERGCCYNYAETSIDARLSHANWDVWSPCPSMIMYFTHAVWLLEISTIALIIVIIKASLLVENCQDFLSWWMG